MLLPLPLHGTGDVLQRLVEGEEVRPPDAGRVYVDRVAKLLNETKEIFLVGGLQYELVDDSRALDDRWYPLSILNDADLHGYEGPNGNIVSDDEGKAISFASKSPYKNIVVDSSTVEREFALALLQREEVKTFVKLPSSFTLPTPFGPYNPDWAVMVELPDGGRYIVFETKGTANTALLRPTESGKTAAAKLHFETVSARTGHRDLAYAVVSNMSEADGVLDDEPLE